MDALLLDTFIADLRDGQTVKIDLRSGHHYEGVVSCVDADERPCTKFFLRDIKGHPSIKCASLDMLRSYIVHIAVVN